ncbi:MAG: hypothetical protein V1867_05990 [Candidatus Falkowbacteria bacterium]
MDNNLKKLQLKLKAAAFMLLAVVIGGFLVLSLFYREKAALALQGNYDKDASTQNQLTLTEWNYLDEDFLKKEGDTWAGPGALNMGDHAITGLNTNLSGPAATDAANVAYVNQAIAAGPTSGGGEIYTVWGNNTCGGGSTLLYGGIALSAPYNTPGGGSNPVCMEGGDPGAGFTAIYADKMYPVVTGADANLPTSSIDPGSTIAGDRIIRCAVCHYPAGTCYTNYGSWDCNGGNGGFSPVYDGYVLGSYSTSAGTYVNSTKRACVNRVFSGAAAGGNMGAMWFGTRIDNNYGLASYTTGAFVKCSVCCN